MQNENLFFFSFLSVSNLAEAKVVNDEMIVVNDKKIISSYKNNVVFCEIIVVSYENISRRYSEIL